MNVKRMMLVKIHMLLAAFILPVAIMFSITGGLYTWGTKGDYQSESLKLGIEQPLVPNLSTLLVMVEGELKKRNLSVPTGNPKIKMVGTSFRFEWSGSNRDVTLAPTSNPSVAQLKINNTSWYRQFVQLHKAKGGTPFKVLAAIFAVGLLGILVSGCWIAWQVPKYQKMMFRAACVGMATFFITVFLS